MSTATNVLIGLLALAFLGPPLLLIAAVLVGAMMRAGRAVLARLRTAADDDAIGEAPPVLLDPPVVEMPAALTRWWHPTDRALFAERFAALAATMPDLARIDIQRLQALYPIPSVESTKE